MRGCIWSFSSHKAKTNRPFQVGLFLLTAADSDDLKKIRSCGVGESKEKRLEKES